MIPITAPVNVRVIAHRGASAYAPENTLPAFALAKEMGCTEIELDTQLSSDGEIVLCHDTTLTKYGHGDRTVESLPAAELLALDMGRWFSPHLYANTPMLTLDQLFAAFGDTFIYHVELKGAAPTLPHAVYDVVTSYDLLDHVIFTSFSDEQLARLRSITITARLGWLVNEIDDKLLQRAARLELFQLCPRADLVDAALVDRLRTVAPEVRAWGISGSPQRVRQLIVQVIDAGCDGMTINWPDWITAARR